MIAKGKRQDPNFHEAENSLRMAFSTRLGHLSVELD
jgi:hypothetical protein